MLQYKLAILASRWQETYLHYSLRHGARPTRLLGPFGCEGKPKRDACLSCRALPFWLARVGRLARAWLVQRKKSLKGLVRGEVTAIDHFHYAQLDFTKGNFRPLVPLIAQNLQLLRIESAVVQPVLSNLAQL